jgi:TorA maturation chaperone TorD
MNSATEQELIRRGDTFKLLAACFYEPDKELLQEQHVCANLAGLLRKIDTSAAAAAEAMATALAATEQQQLSIDHAALFVGPFELPAAPYGSVYLERQRRTMGDSTMMVQRFYREAGLSIDVAEPPDHIAIELEFLFYLCRKEAEAGASEQTQRYRTLQAAFFNQALLPWMKPFCSAIRSATTNPFYLALAACLEQFIESCRPIYRQLREGTDRVVPQTV